MSTRPAPSIARRRNPWATVSASLMGLIASVLLYAAWASWWRAPAPTPIADAVALIGQHHISARGALDVDVRLASPGISTRDDSTQLLISLNVPRGFDKRAPAHIIFVVDRSTSMSGEWMPETRNALHALAGLLRDDDRISLITYGDHAEVLLDNIPTTDAQRPTIDAAISRLRVQGDTCLSCGLERALDIVQPSSTHVQRAILLSDGQPTTGDRSPEALSGLVEQLASRGVILDTVGLGVHHNEALLSRLSIAGQGTSVHVADPRFLPFSISGRSHLSSDASGGFGGAPVGLGASGRPGTLGGMRGQLGSGALGQLGSGGALGQLGSGGALGSLGGLGGVIGLSNGSLLHSVGGLRAARQTVARRTRAVVTLAPGVQLLKVADRSASATPGQVVIDLGDITVGQDVTALLSLSLSPGADPSVLPVAHVAIEYDDTFAMRRQTVSGDLSIIAHPDTPSPTLDTIDPRVVARIERARFNDNLWFLQRQLERGEGAGATSVNSLLLFTGEANGDVLGDLHPHVVVTLQQCLRALEAGDDPTTLSPSIAALLALTSR